MRNPAEAMLEGGSKECSYNPHPLRDRVELGDVKDGHRVYGTKTYACAGPPPDDRGHHISWVIKGWEFPGDPLASGQARKQRELGNDFFVCYGGLSYIEHLGSLAWS